MFLIVIIQKVTPVLMNKDFLGKKNLACKLKHSWVRNSEWQWAQLAWETGVRCCVHYPAETEGTVALEKQRVLCFSAEFFPLKTFFHWKSTVPKITEIKECEKGRGGKILPSFHCARFKKQSTPFLTCKTIRTCLEQREQPDKMCLYSIWKIKPLPLRL